MKFTAQEVVEFKQATRELQRKVESGNIEWQCGICLMLRNITKEVTTSYDVMRELLGRTLYNKGIGPDHELNEDRRVFLEFLAYTITEEDILEICNQKGV